MPSVYVRSALAFVYFGELPENWSEHIFSINFLHKLDTNMDKNAYVSIGLRSKKGERGSERVR